MVLIELNDVKIIISPFLVGSEDWTKWSGGKNGWTITWLKAAQQGESIGKGSWEEKYSISSSGVLSIVGVMGSGVQLVPSEKIGSIIGKGWYKWTYNNRNNYVTRNQGGLELRQFSTSLLYTSPRPRDS